MRTGTCHPVAPPSDGPSTRYWPPLVTPRELLRTRPYRRVSDRSTLTTPRLARGAEHDRHRRSPAPVEGLTKLLGTLCGTPSVVRHLGGGLRSATHLLAVGDRRLVLKRYPPGSDTTASDGTRSLARCELGGLEGDQRGGLGRDPSAAPRRGHEHQGDRKSAEPRGQHRARGDPFGDAVQLWAPAQRLGRDAVEPRIRELLSEFPEMPATVIAERSYWDRGITILRDRVAELRPLFRPPDPCQRTFYAPGELTRQDGLLARPPRG